MVLKVMAGKRSSGFQFESIVPNDILPKNLCQDVETGIIDSLASGIQYGYQIQDVHAILVSGSYHPDVSTGTDFQYAASQAFREACMKADPILLAPIMNVEITLPGEFLGDVIGNIQMRKGLVEGIEAKKQFSIIKVKVPLSKMFGYATELRSLTQGRATYTMQLAHFDEVEEPKQVY